MHFVQVVTEIISFLKRFLLGAANKELFLNVVIIKYFRIKRKPFGHLRSEQVVYNNVMTRFE
jgi:hypothetical protein